MKIRFIVPAFLLAPLAFACGGSGASEDDDALVSESASLALASEDGTVDESSEGALGGMSGDSIMDDSSDESLDNETGDGPRDVNLTCNFGEMKRAIVERFDTNGDGRLDASEREALRGDIAEHPRARFVAHKLLGIGNKRPHFHVWARIKWAFDADNDGVLSAEERAELVAALEARCEARKAKLLENFDADGDGQLSRAELAAALQAAKDRFQEKKADVLARYDANHDGMLDETERAAAKADIRAHLEQVKADVIAEYDVDGNGTLDEAERAALKAAIRDRIAQGGGRPF